MRIVVVGCKGFLGASFSRLAALHGHSILGIARSAQPEPGYPGLFRASDAACADLAPVLREFKPDVVLHAAGTASVGASLDAPLDDLRGSLMTWANTLDAVRRSAVDAHVVFPSSAAVYGSPASLPIAEHDALAPVSAYGFHKLACELVAREYAELYGSRVTVARLFSLYGPRQRRLLLWEVFAQAVGPSSTVELAGTGQESRDYLHVDDACEALLRLSARPSSGSPPGIVNVASGRETRVREAAELVLAASSPAKRLQFSGQARPGDPLRWVADIGRLASLGLPTPRPLAQGIAECVVTWRAAETA